MADQSRITVIAGVNGAGKSSVIGEFLRDGGDDYFNPDEATRRIKKADPSLSEAVANGLAWKEGERLLLRAIDQRTDFTFETTLGGASMTEHLFSALAKGIEVAMVFVGLDSAERHMARVRSRAQAGGHDIPEAKIRERYVKSIENAVRLAPLLTALRVFDNSIEGDPKTGEQPAPRLLFETKNGSVVFQVPLEEFPDWAKPIFAALNAGR
ncbi:MAG: zeta toxin family protein [Archangium sp.]